MVFGILVDVPLLASVFVVLLVFRRRLTRVLTMTGLPLMLLYLLLCVPLIIFEEQIDCQAAWCGKVLIPPTLPFLFVEIFVLGGIALVVHARRTFRVTLAFSIYGVFFEILVGGLRNAPLIVAVVLAPYVALGYAFVSLLPLSVLLEGGAVRPRAAGGERPAVASQCLVLYKVWQGGRK